MSLTTEIDFKLSFEYEDDAFVERLSTIPLENLIHSQNAVDEKWLEIAEKIVQFLGEGETFEDKRLYQF